MFITGVKAASVPVAAQKAESSIDTRVKTKAATEPKTAATDSKAEKPKRRRKADK